MRAFGIVVKVNDLDGCRIFYRELLGLGEPVVDSSFVTVFEVREGFSLTLEKSAATWLDSKNSPIALRFEIDDPEALRDRMEEAGYTIEFDEICRASGACFRGFDPEGNAFYVHLPLA
ncbi:MAG: hypothetical protein PHI35_00885 [Victivallaceae bacterium]|nr:hypothetical protein [Victivallaceae bacterium]